MYTEAASSNLIAASWPLDTKLLYTFAINKAR